MHPCRGHEALIHSILPNLAGLAGLAGHDVTIVLNVDF
jgi:hypothetical protein